MKFTLSNRSLRFNDSHTYSYMYAKKARNQRIFSEIPCNQCSKHGSAFVCVRLLPMFTVYAFSSHCTTFPFPYLAYALCTMCTIKYLTDVFWDQVKARRLMVALPLPLPHCCSRTCYRSYRNDNAFEEKNKTMFVKYCSLMKRKVLFIISQLYTSYFEY